jgi:hypothetical protein
MVRRFIFSRNDIFEGRWSMRQMSDLKAPTYEDPRRSGLYGPTIHLFAKRNFQKPQVHDHDCRT